MTDEDRYDMAIHRAYETAIERLFNELIANAAGSSSFEGAVRRYHKGVVLIEKAFKSVVKGS